MFEFLKSKISTFYHNFTSKIASFFSSNRQVDEDFYLELEAILLSADVGIKKTTEFIQDLKQHVPEDGSMVHVKDSLQRLMKGSLEAVIDPDNIEYEPQVLLVVGINGVGKTSFIGKYAHRLTSKGRRVLIVAADTFRAAAVDQLHEWADRSRASFFSVPNVTDPASVVFDGCTKFVDEQFDHIIIDTAGRLQSKANLMKELEKIRRVIGKAAPKQPVHTWLVVDGVLGQNSLEQAKVFHESTHLNGVVVTKLDGTAKGGVLFAIVDELKVPVTYVSHGESINDVSQFSVNQFVQGIFNG